MSEKRASNKYCVVPECRNTSRNAPEKVFISVPFDPATRKVWQKAMRRDVFVSEKSHVYCCADHFNVSLNMPMCKQTTKHMIFIIYFR